MVEANTVDVAGSPTSDLRVEVVTSHNGLMALEAEWRALEPRMLALPFVSFDWVRAWCQHLRSNRSMVRDDLCLFVFRAPDGSLVAVAPLMVTRRLNVGPARVSQLQFIGADVNITELRCIAAPVEDMSRIYIALLEQLARRPISCDWFKLTGIHDQTLVAKITAMFGPVRWSREVPNFILELKPTWEEFKSGLSRNIKESLRKCYNAPKRDGLSFEFSVVESGQNVDAALAEFLRLHSLRASIPDTTPHPDVFQSDDAKHFLRDVCESFARQNRLRIFQLRYQDAVIATRIGLVCGDSIYLYYSGYDPKYAQYSVMTTTVAESIQYAIANGFRTINLSVGRDVSKARWKPTEIPYQEIEVLSKDSFAAFKYQLFKSASGGLKNSWLAKLVARNAT